MNRQTTTPQSRRCTALRRDGQPCRAWALRQPRDHAGQHPPLCAAHAPKEKDAQSAPVADDAHDRPAALATHQGQPPVINLGSGQAFYAPAFTDEELGALEAITESNSLVGEIMMVRGLIRRLLLDFRVQGAVKANPLDRRAGTLFNGALVVMQLLQAERELEIDADGVPRPIAEALDEIGEEWGIDL